VTTGFRRGTEFRVHRNTNIYPEDETRGDTMKQMKALPFIEIIRRRDGTYVAENRFGRAFLGFHRRTNELFHFGGKVEYDDMRTQKEKEGEEDTTIVESISELL